MKYILPAIVIIVFSSAVWYFSNTSKMDTAQKQNQVAQKDQYAQPIVYEVDQADFVDAELLTADIQTGELSDTEAEGLVYMREEEKLARDVYQTLYEKWGAKVFVNITQSEQTHMDAVLTLLNRYGLTDPASAQAGVFQNVDLQTLYTDLVAQGSASLIEAYNVGALIEDLDINDLELYMSGTIREDLLVVYENLQRGSRNHLRAFNSQIEQMTGTSYVPVYISETAFIEIIGNDTERGPKGGRGRN